MRSFVTSSAIALFLGLGLTGLAHAEQSGASAAGASSQAASTGSAAAGQPAKGVDKLTQSLKQAGFQGVQILDAAFLVRAKTADGAPVVMSINPPASAAGAAAGASQTQAGGQAGGQQAAAAQQKLVQALKQSGFQEVEVVDAAYLVQAKSADGVPVTMMIDPPAGRSQPGQSKN
jgi:hypothetical protein